MINLNRNTFYLDKADKNNIYNDIYSSQSIILSAKLVFSNWPYILPAGCVTISFWIIFNVFDQSYLIYFWRTRGDSINISN
jgi:divalent metal cation (Fe/Co/Zn/Cd) transporter